MSEEKTRTPTQTLVDCMESFGEDDPQDLLIVYTTKSGDFCMSCTTDRLTTKLGLLEFAKAFVTEGAFKREGNA